MKNGAIRSWVINHVRFNLRAVRNYPDFFRVVDFGCRGKTATKEKIPSYRKKDGESNTVKNESVSWFNKKL